MFGRLKFSRSAWLAIGGILSALGAAMSGNMPWSQAIPALFAAFGLLFLRDGIAKAKGT